MSRKSARNVVCIAIWSGTALSSGASTIKPLSFAERIEEAALIVQGTVVSLETVRRGGDDGERRGRVEKESVLPQSESAQGAGGSSGLPVGAAAVPLEVEGGSMVFTRVTFEVEDEVYGIAGRQVVFDVAGGVDGTRSVIVHGMPTFELNRRYLLFLREDFETVASPIVGVHQGFFEISTDEATGREFLLDSNGDFVVGIEGDQILLRRNELRATRPIPQLGPGPTADTGAGDSVATTSAEVQRYWQSSEPPMPISDFRGAVLTAKGVVR